MRIRTEIGDHPALIVALAAATAALAAYELAQGARMSAIALCFLPLVALALSRPTALLVPLGASLPLLHSFGVGGTLVTISDVLLMFVFVGVTLQALVGGETGPIAALRPVAFPLAVYAALMVVVLSAHVSVTGIVQTGQRFELFLFPLVVGAFAGLSGRVTPMLQAYVVTATLLAVAWPLDL